MLKRAEISATREICHSRTGRRKIEYTNECWTKNFPEKIEQRRIFCWQKSVRINLLEETKTAPVTTGITVHTPETDDVNSPAVDLTSLFEGGEADQEWYHNWLWHVIEKNAKYKKDAKLWYHQRCVMALLSLLVMWNNCYSNKQLPITQTNT